MSAANSDRLLEQGRALKRRGDVGGAYTAFLAASRAEPGSVVVWMELAELCMQHGQADMALQFSERAIGCDQRLVRAHVICGWAYSVKIRYEDAERCYAKAVELDPDHVFARGGKADSLVKQGKCREAFECIEGYLTAARSGPGIAVALADIALETDKVQQATALLEALLNVPGYPLQEIIFMRFALGRLYDRIGEYDRAFIHYSEGNRLSPHDISIERDRQRFDVLMQMFSNDRMAGYPRARSANVRQVFIMGMPRSGTSLVEQILSCHSEVHAGGEMQILPEIAANMPNLTGSKFQFPLCMESFTSESADSIIRQYETTVETMVAGKKVITDKLPHNFLLLGLINLLFPGAKVIHCTRDPLDTCLSIYFQFFGVSNGFDGNDMTSIAHHYNNYRELMAHWKRVCDLPDHGRQLRSNGQ